MKNLANKYLQNKVLYNDNIISQFKKYCGYHITNYAIICESHILNILDKVYLYFSLSLSLVHKNQVDK